MNSRFAYTSNGRTAQEVSPDDPEARISKSLHRLNGDSLFAYSLWRQPDGVEWGNRLPTNWPHEYLQSAGAAGSMSLEFRRIEEGEHRQYGVGRADAQSAGPDHTIVWGPNRRELVLPASEVFTADEALPVYMNYYRTGEVPDGYTLRLLDLTYPPQENSTAGTTA